MYRTIIMLSASSMCRNIYCQTSIYLCVNKRRTHNLYHSSVYLALPSGQLRCTFNSADQSRLATPLDLCNRFWTFVASESVVSKTFSNDSIVGMIIVRGDYRLYVIVRSIIGFARSHSNVSLAFSSSSFSSSSSSSFSFSFLSRLGADTVSSSRNFLLSHARRGCQQSVAAVW